MNIGSLSTSLFIYIIFWNKKQKVERFKWSSSFFFWWSITFSFSRGTLISLTLLYHIYTHIYIWINKVASFICRLSSFDIYIYKKREMYICILLWFERVRANVWCVTFNLRSHSLSDRSVVHLTVHINTFIYSDKNLTVITYFQCVIMDANG
jgi:hypothetical protein